MVAVDLDELRQLRLLDLHVDVRVPVVVEDPEEPVDADVDARGLEQGGVVGVDLDPALRQQPRDRGVGQDHERDRNRPRGVAAARYRGAMATVRAIELKTEIPGPRSRDILARKDAVVASPLDVYLPVVVAEGRGATLTDVDGNTFIDFTGGVGCLNVGHAHPHVVEAVQEQAARFFHTDFTIVPYEVYVSVAERLLALAPFRGPAKAAFFNAGTEAVENAVKFARVYTGRPAVIAFEGGFHGRTLLSLTLTSKTHPYKAGLGPFAPEVYRVPFPYEYRGINAADALAALERALVTQVAPETVAAIVVEPVQGEGGFIVAPPEFLAGVREICDRHGIVLIVDEVQTGFGRTGRMFAIEHYDVEPDLITVAKSLAGGLPLSGVLGKAEIMDAPGEGAIGGTYVGNPVALAAAGAVLDVFEDEGLVDARRAHRRDHSGQDAGVAAPASADRRRPRPGSDARDRARRGPHDEEARTGAGLGGRRGGGRARTAAPEGGNPFELHSRPLPARDLRHGGRRGARRLGRGAGRGSRVAVEAARAFYRRGTASAVFSCPQIPPRPHGR